MEITNRDRFWMNSKVFQAWRFMILNAKILKATEISKQPHNTAKLPQPTSINTLHPQVQE